MSQQEFMPEFSQQYSEEQSPQPERDRYDRSGKRRTSNMPKSEHPSSYGEGASEDYHTGYVSQSAYRVRTKEKQTRKQQEASSIEGSRKTASQHATTGRYQVPWWARVPRQKQTNVAKWLVILFICVALLPVAWFVLKLMLAVLVGLLLLILIPLFVLFGILIVMMIVAAAIVLRMIGYRGRQRGISRIW